ncbi:cop9 signalosome complex subunit [Chytriomyces hyalinus]|nr:cop9 signalosome complex subunit [Chytriomyces hyalinus]
MRTSQGTFITESIRDAFFHLAAFAEEPDPQEILLRQVRKERNNAQPNSVYEPSDARNLNVDAKKLYSITEQFLQKVTEKSIIDHAQSATNNSEGANLHSIQDIQYNIDRPKSSISKAHVTFQELYPNCLTKRREPRPVTAPPSYSDTTSDASSLHSQFMHSVEECIKQDSKPGTSPLPAPNAPRNSRSATHRSNPPAKVQARPSTAPALTPLSQSQKEYANMFIQDYVKQISASDRRVMTLAGHVRRTKPGQDLLCQTDSESETKPQNERLSTFRHRRWDRRHSMAVTLAYPGLLKCPYERSTEDLHQLFQFTREMPAFKQFNDLYLQEVCKVITYERFERDEYFFKQGDEGTAWYILISGAVSVLVSKTGDIADSTVVRKMEAGEGFGDLALVNRCQRSASVQATVQPTEVIKVVKADYDRLVKNLFSAEVNLLENYLRKVPVFQEWTKGALKAMAQRMFRKKYKAKQAIYAEDQDLDAIYFLKRGVVSVIKTLHPQTSSYTKSKHTNSQSSPMHVILGLIQPYQYFGQEGFMRNARFTSASAHTSMIAGDARTMTKEEINISIMMQSIQRKQVGTSKARRRAGTVGDIEKDVRLQPRYEQNQNIQPCDEKDAVEVVEISYFEAMGILESLPWMPWNFVTRSNLVRFAHEEQVRSRWLAKRTHEMDVMVKEKLRNPNMSIAKPSRIVPVSSIAYASAFDVEAYAANYKGFTRVARLEFIASIFPSASKEALQLAINDVRSHTLDTVKFQSLVQKLSELGVYSDPAADQMWVENAAKLAREKLEKLDAQLKNYKSNLIKESIRMGHMDLGDHFNSCGDLQSAFKCYLRSREYCSTSKHVLDMCFNIIRVSMDLRNFSHVQSYALKAESTPDASSIPPGSSAATAPTITSPVAVESSRALVLSKLKACMGLVSLDAGKFKAAARSFLEVGPELVGRYPEVISGSDIANYIVLLALATFDRADIKSKVIDNALAKHFLELADPMLRDDVLNGFYSARYGACLDALEKLKTTFLLDMYLNPHVPHLYSLIRRRIIVQFVQPFNAVDMRKMSAALGGVNDSHTSTDETRLASLEAEIARLIEEGVVKARIDSHNKVLRINKSDERSTLFKKSLEMGQDYAKQVNFLLLRASLMRQDLFVEPPHTPAGGNFSTGEGSFDPRTRDYPFQRSDSRTERGATFDRMMA